MSNEREIKSVLKDFEKRISSLESVIGKPKMPKQKVGKQSLADYIIFLREGRFFSQPQTAEETHAKLKGKYHCELNRVAMALLRLAGRKKLRKALKIVSGKKYKAYVW